MRHHSDDQRGSTGLTQIVWPQLVMTFFILALVLLFPAMALAAAAAVLLGQLTLLFLCTSLPRSNTGKDLISPALSTNLHRRALSIHIAARNEPPDLLIATLASLLRQTEIIEHEVIVLINNTPDPTLWRPVEKWCRAAGPRFRFIRCSDLHGAKAGALNIALARTSAGASHVVTIDADYQVCPDFLSVVDREIARSDADFLQFPQAYRHISMRTEGLSLELAEYFTRLARAANSADAMLLTGTLSVIRREALVAVGGWPDRSCTEDAELGTVLIAAGYHGEFIDRIVGRGLMPLDLQSLHSQRHRWAAGNARVLVMVVAKWAGGRHLQKIVTRQNILLIAQLSAWLNLGGLALVTLLAGVAHLVFAQNNPAMTTLAEWTLSLSILSISLILVGSILPILLGSFATGSKSIRCQAIASRIAMIPIGASATLVGVLPQRQTFRVTRKQVLPTAQHGFNPHLVIVGFLALTLLGVGVALHSLLVTFAGALLLLPLICAFMCRRSIGHYAADVTKGEMEWTCLSAL